MQDYRKAVAQSKRRMKAELDGSRLMETQRQAREELLSKSVQRECRNNTIMDQSQRVNDDTVRTLESFEAKVQLHIEKANM